MNDLPAQLHNFPFHVFVHLASLLAIVFLLYSKRSGSKEFCFSYMAIGIVVFALCFMLERVELELGFALGLFAIFGIIRYRTITIPIKEMTYLFVIIGVSVINALVDDSISIIGLLSANAAIFVCLALLEAYTVSGTERSMLVRYEKIEYLQTGHRDRLLADLSERLGKHITDVSTEDVDFLRDTANLRVFFEDIIHKPETISDAPVLSRTFSDH